MVIIFLRTKDISFNNNYKSLCESRNVSWGPTDNLISPEGGEGGGGPKAKHFHYFKYRRSAFVPTPAETP